MFNRWMGGRESNGGQALAPYDGKTGSFTVGATNKTGADFRAGGRLAHRDEGVPGAAELGLELVEDLGVG